MQKKLLLAAAMALAASLSYAQTKTFWEKTTEPSAERRIANARAQPVSYQVFELDMSGFHDALLNAPSRERAQGRSDLVINFPDPDGVLQRYRVVEASVLHPDLAAKYPGIGSFAGQGIDDPTASIRFSLSESQGFHGMVLRGEKNSYFIDPYSVDKMNYIVYKKSDLREQVSDFQCFTEQGKIPSPSRSNSTGKTDDRKLRRYRLALSCNAEYGNLFAGTGTDAQKKGNILAQMNVTMTRVNGIYERDLAITMQIVANNDLIIYHGSTSADPWSNEYNNKTQQVIDAAIGNANYDIGHNFNTSGGGNAGCIGCVCVSGSKGSGFTGRANPTGDAFDIDYVAHEIGHQFGGYHTQTNARCISGDESTSEVEPGSGSTIMGYAGICAANVQSNSDAYFHYVSIENISKVVQTGAAAGCAQIINLANNPPIANAGPDYTIPKSTPFVLKGQGSDPDGDALTYTWEQIDLENLNTTSNAAPSSTKTVGPMFRSREGTASPDRCLPQMSDVVGNNITPTWEVVPSVGRTLNFALTVRDNKAGGGQTASDLMRITVNGTAGPFTVSAPNTAVSWTAGSTQTVTWNVASTNLAPVNCANVNILLSTDGGFTYPVTLVSNTPNDGSQSVTIPNNISNSCRIKVEAADNIFFDISNVNFVITGQVICTATVPTGLGATNVTSNSAMLTWNSVAGATYDIQYKATGAANWITVASSTPSLALSGLTAQTQYDAQVRSKCTNTTSAYSSPIIFTTTNTQLNYCASKGNSVADEFIGRVQLGSINNSSSSNGGYGNFTSLSTDLVKGSSNTITITPSWTGTVYNEGYGVWIDYNKDGDFADAGEQVWTRSASKTTPVSGTFTVPSTATTGNTRMRVSMKYNGVPTACETFGYGEVEDYSVNIIASGGSTCTNITLSLKFDNYPEETSWTLKNSSNTTIASGGPYTTAADGSTITSTQCLPAGCYTFTIHDSYGDGICCSYGNGSYSIKDVGGTTLASGSSFGSSQSHSICVENTARTDRGSEPAFLTSGGYLYPNPVEDQLSIHVPENVNVKSITINSNNGIMQKVIAAGDREVNVEDLSAGMYILSIETDKGIIREKFVKK